MKELNSHIVSSLRWNTTFDRKEKASELQERLSAWSRFTMPREMAVIFDKICPPDQTWRIKPFELDLGFTNYTTLEQELSEKLRHQLYEKLIELVFYANRQGSGTIEIVGSETSRLGMLAAFLVSGLMPWNYQAGDGSVNQLMAYQLQHNRRDVIAMIREVGAEHAVARQRLAWQFNEPVIVSVIAGLEPNYHTQIIDFSNDVVAIQRKENVVNASVSDLKKNLWHWILNYLLKERGTLFNKLAFMRSSIGQMASHYNIGYNALLTLIERAVDTVIEKTTLRSEFVKTLKMLSTQNRIALEAAAPMETEADHWQDLETFFRKPGQCNTSEKKKTFNELVINLEQQDKKKFSSLVSALGDGKKIWIPAVQQLNDSSLEVIVSALSPTGSHLLMETLYFFQKSARAANIKLEMKQLWHIGLDFLHQHKQAAFNKAAFTKHCISAISAQKKINMEQLLTRLAMANIQGSAKTLAALEVYNQLRADILVLQGTSPAAFDAMAFHKLLHRLGKQLRSGHTAAMPLKEWQRVFNSYIRSNPVRVMKELMHYPDQQTLVLLLNYVMTASSTQALLAQVKHPNAQLLLWLQTTLAGLNNEKSRREAGYKKEHGTGTYKKENLSVENNPGREKGERAEDQISSNTVSDALSENNKAKILQASPERQEKKESIEDLFSNLKEEEKEQIKEEVMQQLLELGLQVILKNPGMSPPAFLRALLKQSRIVMQGSQRAYLHRLLAQLPAGEAIEALGITAPVLAALKENLPLHHTQFNTAQLKRLIRRENLPKALTGTWLLSQYEHAEFKALRRQNGPIADELIYYFLPGGNVLLERLLNDYTPLLLSLKTGTELTVIQQLKDLFWKIVLDYSAHRGNMPVVRRLFKAAAAIHFNIKEETGAAFLRPSQATPPGGWVQLENGSRLSLAQFYLLAEQCLSSVNGTVIYRGKSMSVEIFMRAALRLESTPLLSIFSQKQITAAAARKITVAVSFHAFVVWMMQDSAGNMRHTLKVLHELPALLECMVPGSDNRQFTEILWQHTWQLVKAGRVPSRFIETLLGRLIKKMSTKKINSPEQIQEQLSNKGNVISNQLAEIVNTYLPGVISSKALGNTSLPAGQLPVALLSSIEEKGVLEDLAIYILTNKQVPAWLHTVLPSSGALSTAALLNGIIAHHPALFLKIYAHRVLPQAQLQWLEQVVHFSGLMEAIATLHGNRQSLSGILAQLHVALGHLVIRGIAARELQALLFKKVMKAWASDNWRLVSSETIWSELIWDASSGYGVLKDNFIKEAAKQLTLFPPALQTAFYYLAELNKTITAPVIKEAAPKLKPKHAIIPLHTTQGAGGIPVKNAGMVLLQSYVPLLFERLGLLNDKKFNTDAAQADAVHYLQYVVTGLTHTEETFLPLNKVLCGLPFTTPLKPGIDLADDQKTLIDGLIQAAMGYWPAIGNNSINGFRGNWLVRDGLLVEQEERWELSVDKRAYDLLIHKSPFSFSIIKYPWMDKPLHVNWPY